MIYTTRNLTKFLALCDALSSGGFDVATLSHGGANMHHHIETNATEEQFKIARASINIPSSNPSPDMPDPDGVVMPDTIAAMWPGMTWPTDPAPIVAECVHTTCDITKPCQATESAPEIS